MPLSYCENLEFNGKDDWRLPNVNELKSIINYAKSKPAINSAFKNKTTYFYWSSTTYDSYSDVAWRINSRYGFSVWNSKSQLSLVRCVR